MQTSYKGTDKEGRIRLGHDFANKQWQVSKLENNVVVLVPMQPVTDEEADTVFSKVLNEHKKTLDSLQ